MATILSEINTLANDPVFTGNVTAAVLLVGADIIKTVVDTGRATPLDKAKVQLAQDAIDDPVRYGKQFARILAVQPTIISTSTDAQIINVVTAAWVYLARITL